MKPTAWHSIIADGSFEPGDIVWVPFPFVEQLRERERPTLILATLEPVTGMKLAWALMITSSANRGWTGDISLEARFAECGLRVPCLIRTAKFATIAVGRAEKVGALPADLLAEVRAELSLRLS